MLVRLRRLFLLLALATTASLVAGETESSIITDAEANPAWGELLGFAVVGSIIVGLTLVLLWGLCELVGLFFKRQATNTASSSVPVAVIAAAVATVIDDPHEVIDIHERSPR